MKSTIKFQYYKDCYLETRPGNEPRPVGELPPAAGGHQGALRAVAGQVLQ